MVAMTCWRAISMFWMWPKTRFLRSLVSAMWSSLSMSGLWPRPLGILEQQG